MPPTDEDPVSVVVSTVWQFAIDRMRLQMMAAAVQQVKTLEAEVGRELPEVRARIESLYGLPQALPAPTPRLPLSPLPPSLPEGDPPKRRPGRPRKYPPDSDQISIPPTLDS